MRPAPLAPAAAAAPPARPARLAGLAHAPRTTKRAPCPPAAVPGSVWWLDPVPAGGQRPIRAAAAPPPTPPLANLAAAAEARRLPADTAAAAADDDDDEAADADAALAAQGAALWADPAFREALLGAGCEPAAGCPGLPPGSPAAAGPRLRVALLLSGGVDSATAAALLLAAGHAVTPFYLKIWFEEDFRNTWAACPWEADLADCGAVCASLGLPRPTVVPLTGAYWDRVVSDCVRELRAGRTPNPDVLCNSRVKYGAFVEWLAGRGEGGEGGGGEGGGGAGGAADPLGAAGFDRVATGHYARVIRPGGDSPTPAPLLALCGDAAKDQSYFLARLSPAQRGAAMFPLAGAASKAQVRALAAGAFGLPNAARKDSQGLCFLGRVPFAEFVASHLGTWPGPLLDADSVAEEQGGGKGGGDGDGTPSSSSTPAPRILGYHQGAWFYTPGQRRGIGLAGGPWYVVRKDMSTNAVWVSARYHERGAAGEDGGRQGCVVGGVEWADGGRALAGSLEEGAATTPPLPAPRLRVKVRHGPRAYGAAVALLPPGDGTRLAVSLDGTDQGLAPGQYAVFYDTHTGGGAVVGCGVIEGE